MALFALFIDGDNLIRWDDMRDASTNEPINSATVTFTLKDANAVAVASGVTMSKVTGVDGRYDGTLESTVDLGDPGAQFDLEVTATSGDLVGFRKIRCRSQYKGP